MRVWVTRAEPGATATAARLAERGHSAILASLLRVQAVTPDLPLPPARTLLFTSANAVRAFARLEGARDQDVRVVGAATAQAARREGFARVRSADADVAALARAVSADPPQGEALYPCGRDRAGDLVGSLARCGVGVQPLVLYETLQATAMPPAAAEALAAGALEAVLLHSPKAARVLANLAQAEPPKLFRAVRAVGLSHACLVPLKGLDFAERVSAHAPNELALLERLG